MSMSGDLLILVVEDEPFLLLDYEMAIEDAGHRSIGASSLAEGLAALRPDIDAAILDIRLGEDRVFSLAYRLVEMRIPFVFCSGTAADMPQDALAEAPLLHKPIRAEKVVELALGIMGEKRRA